MIKKMQDLKAKYKKMDDDDVLKVRVLSQIRQIESELKSEFYKVLHDKDYVKNPKPLPKAFLEEEK